MKEKHWFLLFTVILMSYIVSMQYQHQELQLALKPAIMLVLLGYFDSRCKNMLSGMARWILLAILFSMAGDTLLLFQVKYPAFFIYGLAAFLLAHIFYILFFLQLRKKEQVRFRPFTLLIVLVYYAGLMWLLYPGLKDMKVPVMVYGLVISTMFMLAMHAPAIRNKSAGRLMFAGAALFVLSDSVLAIDRFYQHFEWAGIIIMLTYGAAQLLLIKGAADYLSAQEK
ncbi:MAG: lysoplasmalogenase [Bacteroidetes bacterium]|nr:lysoplasmalogenase [Bacteroidota bacterium]